MKERVSLVSQHVVVEKVGPLGPATSQCFPKTSSSSQNHSVAPLPLTLPLAGSGDPGKAHWALGSPACNAEVIAGTANLWGISCV